MEVILPHTSFTVRRVYSKNSNDVDNEVLEGEVPMSQQQQDYYKAVVGDGLARVSVGRDMSEMDFGSGGKVFVSVSLVCNQDAQTINYAVGLAASIADYQVEQHFQQMKQRCEAMGLLKPVAPGRPVY